MAKVIKFSQAPVAAGKIPMSGKPSYPPKDASSTPQSDRPNPPQYQPDLSSSSSSAPQPEHAKSSQYPPPPPSNYYAAGAPSHFAHPQPYGSPFPAAAATSPYMHAMHQVPNPMPMPMPIECLGSEPAFVHCPHCGIRAVTKVIPLKGYDPEKARRVNAICCAISAVTCLIDPISGLGCCIYDVASCTITEGRACASKSGSKMFHHCSQCGTLIRTYKP
jgi:hypothetical protein